MYAGTGKAGGKGNTRKGGSAPAPKSSKPAQRGPLWLRLLKWFALTVLVGTAVAAAGLAFIFWHYGRDTALPNIAKLSDYHPKQVTLIKDREGYRVGELFDERRTFVPFDKIPKNLTDAFVAVEDEHFWTNDGIDYLGMIRAAKTNLTSGKTRQGASTITQQVVKTFLLTPERTIRRKVQEIILARRLTQALSKQDIITLYINQINFGHGRYGAQEASRFYFGKDVDQINLGEAALLAGLPQSPEYNSPLKYPAHAKDRQVHVLTRMVAVGKITQAEAQPFIDQKLEDLLVKGESFPRLGTAPEIVALVKAQLVAERGDVATSTMGGEVKTTIDGKLQKVAQQALQAGLRAVDARHKIGVPIRSIKLDKLSLELAKLSKKLPKNGPSKAEVYEAVITAVHDSSLDVDLGGYVGSVALGGSDDARFNQPMTSGEQKGKTKNAAARFAAGDVIRVVSAGAAPTTASASAAPPAFRLAPGPEGAVIVMDLHTREVRAMVGGYAMAPGGFDRAMSAKRQPGSSFKPLLYTAALASGKYTAASLVDDAPDIYDLWKPNNFEKDTFEGPVRLRVALAKSINTVAIRVLHDLGPDVVIELAAALGITSTLPHELSLALGSGEVTPMEMVGAFATLASGGVYIPPQFISSVDGVAHAAPAPVQAVKPEVAYVITDMMRSVVEEGTGHLAKKLGVPIAGKTGTSNDSRDTWFIGATPDYIIGVWVGNDDNKAMGNGETGGTTAVPIFIDVAKALDLKAKAFPRPAGVTTVTIDKATGLVAPPDAPKGSTLSEVFVDGTAPTEIAPMPGDVDAKNVVTSEYGD